MGDFRTIKNHFLNSLIWRGRKISAEKFFTSVLVQLKLQNDANPFDVFYYSTLNLRPLVFLRPIKVGSVTYRVPAPITNHNRRLYAIKFILQTVRDSMGSITVERVSSILLSIYTASKNAAFDKKIALYEEAMDNRSFIRNLRYIL